MTAVHQVVASLAPRDATGNHALHVQRLLRGMGLDSEIYVREAARELRGRSHPYLEFTGGRRGEATWLLYQASTGSPVADWLLGRPEPKLLCYHNMTPASLFRPWEPHVGAELDLGRRQLRDLAGVTELALAVSTYNEADLRSLGFRSTAVVPFFLDPSSFPDAVDEGALARLRAEPGGPVWLYVGRVAPHKAQHVLIRALAVHHRLHGPGARLRLVGSVASGRYRDALVAYSHELGVGDAVTMVSDISSGELAAHYRASALFVSASEHEGFGVPLLEAMHHGLPVVAVGTSAIPETVGDAALCLPSADAAVLAEACQRVATDAAVRSALVAAGHRRLATFDLADAEARFVTAVSDLLARERAA